MKLQTITTKISMMVSLLFFMCIFGVGCAKKSDGGGDLSAAPGVGTTGTPVTPSGSGNDRGAEWDIGATTALTIDSPVTTILNYYAATHPVNDPTDIRISVKLKNVGSSADGKNITPGQVFVSYMDNNQYYTGRFYALDKKNPTGNLASSGTYYPGWHHAAYNTWFVDPRTKKRSFHGFYQDQYGAVMLIIDNVQDLGDGAGPSSASGSIWFKNYSQSQVDQCGNKQGEYLGYVGACQDIWKVPSWFRLNGPYDTRTFLVAGNDGLGNLDTTSVLYPSESLYYTKRPQNLAEEAPARGWRRLGTFTSLNIAKAFSQ